MHALCITTFYTAFFVWNRQADVRSLGMGKGGEERERERERELQRGEVLGEGNVWKGGYLNYVMM